MGDKKGSDIDDFVTVIAGHETNKRTITCLSLIALSVMDLVLNWDTISKHWSIITGQPYTESHEVSKVKFKFNAFIGSSFNLSVFINIQPAFPLERRHSAAFSRRDGSMPVIFLRFTLFV